jgi:hypothetical protein
MGELTVIPHILCNCQGMWDQTYQSINSLLIVVVPFTPFFTANGKQVRVRMSWYIVVGWAPQLVWTLWGKTFLSLSGI